MIERGNKIINIILGKSLDEEELLSLLLLLLLSLLLLLLLLSERGEICWPKGLFSETAKRPDLQII